MKTHDYFLSALRTAPISPDAMQNQETRMAYLELLVDGITVPKGRAATMDIWHGIIGIAGEASELIELFERAAEKPERSALIKEIGDIWWYVAPLMRGMNGMERDFERVANAAIEKGGQMDHNSIITLSTNRITEPMKKWIWYGKQIDATELEAAVVDVLAATVFVAQVADTTIEEVLETNIAKLKARYPERFDEAAAVAKADEQA